VGWARSAVLGVAVLGMACDDSARPTPLPSPTPTPGPFTSGVCVGDLSEVEAQWRVFPEALVRNGTPCPGLGYAEERHCPGVYVAIAQGDRLILNTTRYFDGNRQLFAMQTRTDVSTHCGGTSFDKTYGTVPTCPTSVIVTDLCRR
jgi:hypothetical protein